MAELNYEFKKRLLEVHKKNRRVEKPLGEGQIEITSAWTIQVPADNELLQRVGRDLQDYFLTSMNVEVGYTRGTVHTRVITYVINPALKKSGEYRVEVSKTKIRLIGRDERAAAQASYLLEDLMNLEEAPYVKIGKERRVPIFRCRMVHSGVGEDDFPDAHLNAIAHAGINTILLFTRDVNRASTRFVDFNDTIARAAKYGLDTYAYSYMRSSKHPDEEGAEEFYDSLYGNLFRKCPGFKGVVFVGESVGFPSRDPRTSGLMRGRGGANSGPDGKPAKLPNPSTFPCNDYPDWLNLVKRIIRRERPDADLVFWTYNWGWVPEGPRSELIANLPTDISLQATFEMFEGSLALYPKYGMTSDDYMYCDGVPCCTADYTLFFAGPGKYFLSEARAAKKRGIPLYSMTNAGGLTWDVGMVPYEPMPYQWLKRYEAMRDCHEKYGLIGSMDSHHYGFWPSFISDLAKAYFTEEQPDGEAIIAELLARDWGKENLQTASKAFRIISEGITYITTAEQYGAQRCGPTYPFPLFRNDNVIIPYSPWAHFGNNYICKVPRCVDITKPHHRDRILGELRIYKKSADMLLEGVAMLQALLPTLSVEKQNEARRVAGIVEFMARTFLTVHHFRRWEVCKYHVRRDESADIPTLCAELREIALAEMDNVRAAIPLADFDSRLGFEPSVEYYADRAHLEWKLAHMQKMLDEDIPELEARGRIVVEEAAAEKASAVTPPPSKGSKEYPGA